MDQLEYFCPEHGLVATRDWAGDARPAPEQCPTCKRALRFRRGEGIEIEIEIGAETVRLEPSPSPVVQEHGGSGR